MLVIAKPDKAKEALEAGADFAGSDEYIKKIAEENWFEFDTLVATPDMMVQVGKIGRVLGPRGLMPNPKVGTVTADVAKAVKRAQGRSRRVPRREGRHHPDPVRQGVVQARGARAEPARAARQLMKLKPATAKGTYMRSITISTTHGPGVKIDPTPFTAGSRSVSRSRLHTTPSKKPAFTNKPCGDEWIHSASRARSRPSRFNRGVVAFRRHHMERAEKEQVLGEIKEAWKNVASIVIADYRGITVPVVTRCAMTSARRAATTA